MLDQDLLQTLLSECRSRLSELDAAHASELGKPVLARNPAFLTFLDKERSVYLFGVSLLTRLGQSAAPPV
jgi:hypothetical protein